MVYPNFWFRPFSRRSKSQIAFFSIISLTKGSFDLIFMNGKKVQSSGPLCPCSWKCFPTGVFVFGFSIDLLCSIHLFLTTLFVWPTYYPLYSIFFFCSFFFLVALDAPHRSHVQMYKQFLVVQVSCSLIGMIWPLCLISNWVTTRFPSAALPVNGHKPQVLLEHFLKPGFGFLIPIPFLTGGSFVLHKISFKFLGLV